MANTLKNTALTEKHKALGAKIVPFAGYNMPVQYEGLNAEHENVRSNVGVFDVSHMGEFFVEGAQADAFLQKVTSNDVAKLTPGKIQYTCLPNNDNGIVDDLLVYCLEPQKYMLVVNASNIVKDFNWLQQHLPKGVTLTNDSDNYSLLAVQGPKAEAVLQKLTAVNLAQVPYYTFTKGTMAGIDDILISATGYTGESGFELYLKNENALALWEAIMDAGQEEGVQPAGLGARDTLRLEMGLCLYGNDIDETTSPLEARLGWITKTETGFINSKALQQQREEGVSRRLSGFEMIERGIPRQHYPIYNAEGELIGEVTSGTHSPSLKKSIGMGYLQRGYNKPDTEIYIGIRKRKLKAKVVKVPFYKKG